MEGAINRARGRTLSKIYNKPQDIKVVCQPWDQRRIHSRGTFCGVSQKPSSPLCQAAQLSIALQATQGPGERCKSYYNYQMSSLSREDTRKGVCPPSLGLSPLSGVSWSSQLPAAGTQLACVSSSDFHCPSCPLRSTPQTAECGVSPGVFPSLLPTSLRGRPSEFFSTPAPALENQTGLGSSFHSPIS